MTQSQTILVGPRPTQSRQAGLCTGAPALPGDGVEAACATFFLKTGLAGPGNTDQRATVINAVLDLVAIPRDQVLPLKAQRSYNLHLLVEGWAIRSYMLPDGGRQITDILLPGDVCAWGIVDGDDPSDEVRACSPARVVVLSREAVGEENSPLRRAVDRTRHLEALTLRRRLVSLGRQDARARISHLLAELYQRLHRVGLADGGVFECPMTQEQLADSLGLTSVHVNRMLQALRHDGLITFNSRKVTIQDLARLYEAAGVPE
jgi:CRP-like cAMP-binding protein